MCIDDGEKGEAELRSSVAGGASLQPCCAVIGLSQMPRVPLQKGPQPLPPRRCNIGVDSNALDRGNDEVRNRLVDRFRTMCDTGELIVVVAGGVRDEVQHPHTPDDVQKAVLSRIFNQRPGLNADQRAARHRIAVILQGNAKPGAHAADASHLSEAAETGCAYFITHDARILRKRDDLRTALPPSLQIVSLAEFFDILDEHEAAREKMPREGASVPEDGEMVEWTAVKSREKGLAVAAIGHALTEIERSGCSADWWEREHLAEAIGALFRGLYRLGATHAQLALEPENQRSPEAQPTRGHDQVSLSDLRSAFALAEAEPLRQFGHFGPIEFVGAAKAVN